MAYQASVNVFIEGLPGEGERSADFTVESEEPLTRALLEEEVFAFVQSLVGLGGVYEAIRGPDMPTYTWEVESVFQF